ncbi:D-alanyl-D-alanine carboxypeptidase family protein [Virgibacillus siamensis]|uniref:D-alanyl-D-alanine carboxypeptidase family protein n=1 Tax=Virgibacillus siamensis TaxID=480071 RepID=UPI000985D44D|nr:D-alanyl-D-alanine carboxypeptidase family protein [Virgibacillus siamensis]
MKHKLQKGLSFLLIALVMMTTVIAQPFSAKAAGSLNIEAESAILVDAESGKIVYSKNPDIKLPPASMTKMMSEYLVLEAIKSGKIDWDTTTQVSNYAYSISADSTFSGIGLTKGKPYKVKELYKAMAIFSDNGATIALAELVAGSEGNFVKMMNKTAKEMGLPDYKFVNSTGLSNKWLGDNVPEGTDPNANNLLSARSAALLAFNLIKDHPEALDYTSMIETKFEGYKVENLNWMLPHKATYLKQFHYKGVDGLKTGYTDLAGYCFTGTVERNGQRFISVVMKTKSKAERFQETEKLYEYAFSNFESKKLFSKGYQLKDKSTIPVSKGKKDTVEIATKEAFKAPVKKGEKKKYGIKYHIDKDKLNKDGELAAPIKKGEKIGTAELVYKGDADYGYIFPGDDKQTVALVAQDSVEKDNWFMLTLGSIGNFFSDLFGSIVDTVKGWF